MLTQSCDNERPWQQSGFTPAEKEKNKNEDSLLFKRTDLILNLTTVTLFYCLSCSLVFNFARHLYVESSKVALYLFANHTDINTMSFRRRYILTLQFNVKTVQDV